MNITKSKYYFLFCLFLLYITWGSVYLVVKLSLEYGPALSLSALRLILSGLLLIIGTRIAGEKIVFTKADIKQYTILAFFMFLIASSVSVKGMETVSSGTTAMILGITPTLMILSDWYYNKIPPSQKQIFGIVIGFCAISCMQWLQGTHGQTSFFGFSLIFISAIGWVIGSHLSTKFTADTQMSIFRSTGLMMLCGGIESLIFALLVGENPLEINLFSPLIMILCVHIAFTIVGYVTYFWLFKNTRPMIAISYEFVNPVIALFLGWLLVGEVVTIPLLIASFFLVTSVFFAVSNKH